MGSYFVLHFGLVAGLVLLAMVLGRSERTRDLAHVAWVLVFVKLLVPAFLEVPVLAPEPVEFAAIEAPLLEAAPPTKGAVVDSIELGAADLALALEPVPAAPAAWSPLALLLAVWAVGALVCAARIVVTMLRFRRLLRGARTPSPSLSAISEQAAATLGLACAPRLCVVDARVSPALWPSIPATVVVPDGLEARLSDEEMRLVLLHEMAHYARRDHWVRLLEAAVQVAYWWLPPVGWLRSRLRASEEACCDAQVLRVAGDGSAYAGALIRAVEFLRTDPRRPSPLAGSVLSAGAVAGQSLSDRITTIMLDRPRRPLRAHWRALFALGLLGVLPLLPAPAKAATPDPVTASYQPPAAPEVEATQSGDEPKQSAAERRVMRKAIALLEAGDRAAAAKLLEGVRGRDATAAFDLLAGKLALEAGELVAADRDLTIAVQKHPTYEQAWRTLGVARLQLERFVAAAHAFEQSIRLGRDDAATYGLYGAALIGSGDLRRAESAYWLASLLEPEERQWRLGLLRALTEQEHNADALTLIGQMLAVRQHDVELLRLKANAHIALGQHEAAADALTRLEAHGNATTTTRLLRAELELKTGRYAQAAATYVAALEADPKGARDGAWKAARFLRSNGADQEASLLYALLEANEDPKDLQLVFRVSKQGNVSFGSRTVGVEGVASLVRRRLAMGETVAFVQAGTGAPTEVVQRVVGEALRAGAGEVSVVAGDSRVVDVGGGVSLPAGRRALELLRQRTDAPQASDVSEPKPISRQSPKLTAALLAKGPGEVEVLLVIDEKGDVIEARAKSSSDPVFEAPALEAVRRWKFAPARLDGKPVRARFRQTLKFPGTKEPFRLPPKWLEKKDVESAQLQTDDANQTFAFTLTLR